MLLFAGFARPARKLLRSHARDRPDWDFGINLALPIRDTSNPTILMTPSAFLHLVHLRSQFGRDLVIGIADNVTGSTDDLFHVECARPRQAARDTRSLASHVLIAAQWRFLGQSWNQASKQIKGLYG